MKKYISLMAVAALLMTVSCTKENNAPEAQDGQTIQLTLQATRGEADTKTAISMNDSYHSLESAWAAGDVIYVYSIKSGEQLGTLTQTGAITSEKVSATSQYSSSYAAFDGSITLGGGDAISDTFAFVYQGAGRSLSVSSDLLTYEIGTVASVDDLNAWDVAYATGKIQGTEGSASCAVNFSNKVAFGYFTTTPVASGSNINLNYYSSFTLNVKNGAITGVTGTVAVPGNAAFYMPLIPGQVNMNASGKTWSQQDSKWGYTSSVQQQKVFTADAGNYYRLGSADSYGPVPFAIPSWTNYETLKGSKFKVADDKYVHFTQGNLQWINTNPSDATAGYWTIAPTQYSYLGTGNAQGNAVTTGSKLNAGSVDLFGWGEVAAPFLCSTVNADYQPSITTADVNLTTDWATKFNGGTPTPLYADYETGQAYPKPAGDGDYCVLTKTEWQNLFANQYWGFATVNLTVGGSVNGLVICPNSITDEASAKAFLTGTVYKSSATQSGKTAAFSENVIDQAVIDNNGLLFLPAAGYRNGAGAPSNVGAAGYYWSATSLSATHAYYVNFSTSYFYSARSSNRHSSFSVRLASVVSE